jgi:hypothetical protein
MSDLTICPVSPTGEQLLTGQVSAGDTKSAAAWGTAWCRLTATTYSTTRKPTKRMFVRVEVSCTSGMLCMVKLTRRQWIVERTKSDRQPRSGLLDKMTV